MTLLDDVNPYVLGQHRKSLSELRLELDAARDRVPATARDERRLRNVLAFTAVLVSASAVISLLVLGAVAVLAVLF
ncbi:MAG: hypothetical protein ABI130_08040 [Leifsonia sp.]